MHLSFFVSHLLDLELLLPELLEPLPLLPGLLLVLVARLVGVDLGRVGPLVEAKGLGLLADVQVLKGPVVETLPPIAIGDIDPSPNDLLLPRLGHPESKLLESG